MISNVFAGLIFPELEPEHEASCLNTIAMVAVPISLTFRAAALAEDMTRTAITASSPSLAQARVEAMSTAFLRVKDGISAAADAARDGVRAHCIQFDFVSSNDAMWAARSAIAEGTATAWAPNDGIRSQDLSWLAAALAGTPKKQESTPRVIFAGGELSFTTSKGDGKHITRNFQVFVPLKGIDDFNGS